MFCKEMDYSTRHPSEVIMNLSLFDWKEAFRGKNNIASDGDAILMINKLEIKSPHFIKFILNHTAGKNSLYVEMKNSPQMSYYKV